MRGYAIDAPQALVLLAEKAPWAAQWWREHAPHCWQPGQLFLFHAEVCAEVAAHKPGRQPPARTHAPSEEFYSARPADITQGQPPKPPDVAQEKL